MREGSERFRRLHSFAERHMTGGFEEAANEQTGPGATAERGQKGKGDGAHN